MKILVDAHFLDGHSHGAAKFLERLYSTYSELAPHHELHFGIEPHADVHYDLFDRPGVHVHRYRFGGASRFLFDIPLLASRIQPDVIHTQYVLPLRLGYTARRHVTLFDVLYEDYPELFGRRYRWSRRLAFGWSARRADLLSTCSDYSRARIITIYRPKASPVRVIHGGALTVNPSEGNDATRVEHGEFLLYVSRFERRKNHRRLLTAFQALLPAYPRLRLVLVGFETDGTLAECERFIDALGIRERVDILSNVSDSRIMELFRSARVVVYPSLCEGFGMPIIEAMLLNPHTTFSNTTAMAI